MKKIILIGRHDLTDKQKLLLDKYFGEWSIDLKLQQVDPANPLKDIDQSRFEAVVVQVLPVDILAKLLRVSRLPVFLFKVEAVAVVSDEREVEDLSRKHDADIVNYDPRSGNYRVAKTVALQRLLRIDIVTEDVATI